MDRVLVTGVNGFLARYLVAELLAMETCVAGLVRQSSKDVSESINIFRGAEALLASGEEFKTVYHLAAYIPRNSDQQDDRLFAEDIELTRSLVKAYPEARFVYASSVSVYGRSRRERISPGSGIINPTLYGQCKLLSERLVSEHSNNMIVRFSSITGRGMSRNTFIPAVINSAQTSGKVVLFGDGTRLQDYIDVRDAAKLCISAGHSDRGGIVIGAQGRSWSNRDVAEVVQELTGCSIEFRGRDNSESYVYDPEGYGGLSFRPKYNLRETIKEMLK